MEFAMIISALISSLSIMVIALGYNLTLPGYDRKKWMNGLSVKTQMRLRRELGREIISFGAFGGALILALVLCLGLLVPIKTVAYEVPEKIDVFHAKNHDLGILIVDGVEYKESPNTYKNLTPDHPGIRYKVRRNLFGMKPNFMKTMVLIEIQTYELYHP